MEKHKSLDGYNLSSTYELCDFFDFDTDLFTIDHSGRKHVFLTKPISNTYLDDIVLVRTELLNLHTSICKSA